MNITRKKVALILAEAAAEAAAQDMGIMQILRAVTRENGKRYEASEKMSAAIAQLIKLIDDPRSKFLVSNWYRQTLTSATRALERAKFQPTASDAKKSDPQPPTQKERDLLAAGDKTAVLRQKARVAHARGDKKGLQAAAASLRQLPKIGTGTTKENKETNSMITRERLEEILREEIVAVTEGMPSSSGHMGQEAPPVENDQRARELLDGFKNMLKPQERAEPSACATFLRQLADMAEREGGASDAGTMPEPVPNN
jgi:hypothetical protein